MIREYVSDRIRDEIKDRVTAKIRRALDENLSFGHEALSHIETDVKVISDRVYDYYVSFTLAKLAMGAPRVSQADYMQLCQRTLRMDELSSVQSLRSDLEELGQLSKDLKRQVSLRIKGQLELADQRLQRYSRMMDVKEASGERNSQVERLAGLIRGAGNDLHRYRANLMRVNRVGGSIQEQLAEIVAVLSEIERELTEHRDGFAYFTKDCLSWRREWHSGM